MVDRIFDLLILASVLPLVAYALLIFLKVPVPGELKAFGIPLPTKKALFATLGMLAACLCLKYGAIPYVDMARKEMQVPPLDQSRFSILVSDFAGTGGEFVGDEIYTRFQILLGDGAQIVRVPCKSFEVHYGDAAVQKDSADADASQCAKKHNGDIVIWGSYDNNTRVLSLAYTIKGDKCFAPKYQLFTRTSPFSISSTDQLPQIKSQLSDSLLSSVTYAILTPAYLSLTEPQSTTCFGNFHFLSSYSRKVDAVLTALSNSIPADDFASVLDADGAFYLFKGVLSRQTVYVQQAVKLFERARATDPTDKDDIIESHAANLSVVAEELTGTTQRRDTAQVVDELAMYATDRSQRPHLILWAGRAWRLVYERSRLDSDYDQAEYRYLKALKSLRSRDDRFFLNVELANLHADKFVIRHSATDHRSALNNIGAAWRIYRAWSKVYRDSYRVEQLYTFYEVALRTCAVGEDAISIRLWLKRAQMDERVARPNWSNRNYWRFAETVAHAYFSLFESLHDRADASQALARLDEAARRVTDQQYAAKIHSDEKVLTHRVTAVYEPTLLRQ